MLLLWCLMFWFCLGLFCNSVVAIFSILFIVVWFFYVVICLVLFICGKCLFGVL